MRDHISLIINLCQNGTYHVYDLGMRQMRRYATVSRMCLWESYDLIYHQS